MVFFFFFKDFDDVYERSRVFLHCPVVILFILKE